MNATKQQHILGAVVNASRTLAQAASALGGSGGAGDAITIPALYLDFLPPELRERARDYFSYGADFLNIAAGATATEEIAIQNDSHFLMVAVAGHVVDPANESTVFTSPALTVEIRDQGSGRNLFNRAAAWANVVGTGQLPAYFPYPKLVDRASTITTTIANVDPAQALRVRMNYIGFKIFGMPRGT